MAETLKIVFRYNFIVARLNKKCGNQLPALF